MSDKERKSLEAVCQRCGRSFEKTHGSQRYCPLCRRPGSAKYKRSAPKKARLLDWHDLRGKSLARVDAEAKAFGLSYGQYTAAVYSGGIDALLRSRGFIDPKAVLMGVKAR